MNEYNEVKTGIEHILHGLELVEKSGKGSDLKAAQEIVEGCDFFKIYPQYHVQIEELERKLNEQDEFGSLATPGNGGYKNEA